MLSLIALPDNFISGALGYTAGLFDDFKLVFLLVAGILIALGIFSSIIGHNKDDNDKE